jgi:hypothetical protein
LIGIFNNRNNKFPFGKAAAIPKVDVFLLNENRHQQKYSSLENPLMLWQ